MEGTASILRCSFGVNDSTFLSDASAVACSAVRSAAKALTVSVYEVSTSAPTDSATSVCCSSRYSLYSCTGASPASSWSPAGGVVASNPGTPPS